MRYPTSICSLPSGVSRARSVAWQPRASRGDYRARRDVMIDALDEHFPDRRHVDPPTGGFYVWVRLPDVHGHAERSSPPPSSGASPTCPVPPSTPTAEATTRCASRSATRPRTRSVRGCPSRRPPCGRGRAVPVAADEERSRSLPAGARPSARSRSARGHRVMTALRSTRLRRIRPRSVPRRRLVETLFEPHGFCVLRRAPRQGGRGRHRPAAARAPGDPVHGHGAARLRDHVRQGPREGVPRRGRRARHRPGPSSKRWPSETWARARSCDRRPSA